MTAQQGTPSPSARLGPAAQSYADRFAPQTKAMTNTRRTQAEIDADRRHWWNYHDKWGWL